MYVMHAASPPTVIVYFAMLYIIYLVAFTIVLVHCFLMDITPWALGFHTLSSLSLYIYKFYVYAVGL